MNEKSYYVGSAVFLSVTEAADYVGSEPVNMFKGNYADNWSQAMIDIRSTSGIVTDSLLYSNGVAMEAIELLITERISGITEGSMKKIEQLSPMAVSWNDVYEPNGQDYYKTGNFTSTNHCGFTAAMNVLQYWRRRGYGNNLMPSNNIVPSSATTSFNELYLCLGCNSWLFDWASGTVAGPYLSGIKSYFASKGVSVSTSSTCIGLIIKPR